MDLVDGAGRVADVVELDCDPAHGWMDCFWGRDDGSSQEYYYKDDEPSRDRKADAGMAVRRLQMPSTAHLLNLNRRLLAAQRSGPALFLDLSGT